MQDDLLGSLRHVAEVGPVALGALLAAPMAVLASGRSLGPEAFGLYYQLVERLLSGELDEALKVGRQLASCPARPAPACWRVMGRGSAQARGLDAILDQRLGHEATDFSPIAGEKVVAFERLLRDALALLAEGLPPLHEELTAMVSDVLLAQAPPGASVEFDGASHYQFWGLLLLNPKHHRDRLAVAEVLAHESGHSVLFGMCREQVLSDNADEERYPSPLRVDPRPMDGIIHATYVSARMAWAMESLAESGCLSPAERTAALQAAADDRRRFHAGLSTVDEHARLTVLGREVIEGARAWIQRSSQLTTRRGRDHRPENEGRPVP
ncbi:MAG: HEXXH motif domain-containing protein [Gammaproteobacteria bacterium]|nr:HEXXH motif domain-containing protein [Gammaproteobacteria bacterium]